MRALRNLVAFVAVISALVALSVAIRRPDTTPHLSAPAESAGPTPTTSQRRSRDPAPSIPANGPPIIDAANAASGFAHPGVLVSTGQLEFVRDRLRARAQPWTAAFDQMRGSSYASLDWSPRARAVVDCGYFSNPDNGCGDEWRDAVAAYTHSLLWYLTGRAQYARKAVEILNAWSATLQAHTNLNAPIQAGWAATHFARAAEIMRHTYPDWPPAEADRTAAMFRNVFLPLVGSGGAPGTWGNWDLIILDAAVGIAVFLDDRPLFAAAVDLWRARVPAYIYLSSDGPYPIGPPGGASGPGAMASFWFGQRTYVDGLTQETCRDLGHTAWGLEAMSQVAETAWIQGIDLYAEIQPRLVSALEFHSAFVAGDEVPGWLCGGALAERFEPLPEIALSHYRDRRGVDLPRTRQVVESGAPQSASNFYAWETLTHAGHPS